MGMKNIWGDHAEIRVLPAGEHLKTVKFARCENHKRLKMRGKLPVLQGTAKVPWIEFLWVAHDDNARLRWLQVMRFISHSVRRRYQRHSGA